MVIILSFLIVGLNYISIKFIGASTIFFFMRLISVYSSDIKPKEPLRLISYIFFVPEMITGPHREYSQWVTPKINFKVLLNLETILKFLLYLNLIFASGLLYKYIIENISFMIIKIVTLSYVLLIQFWSASRIVNLISRIFSQKPIFNFNYPLSAISFSDFWTRWHISLGNFARKFVNQPLSFLIKRIGLNNYITYSFSVFITFLFIALWHKVSFIFLIWALFASVVLILEKTIFKNIIQFLVKNKYGRFLLIIYTQILFLFSIFIINKEIENIVIYPR